MEILTIKMDDCSNRKIELVKVIVSPFNQSNVKALNCDLS